ncbi:hypothetical protein BGX26_004879, partial [Mortierella sp. AD094]
MEFKLSWISERTVFDVVAFVKKFDYEVKESVVRDIQELTKNNAYPTSPAKQSSGVSNSGSHWAWPWVGTKFTAGIQSTQRVESVHTILKGQVHSKTSLQDLFHIIEGEISDTKLNLG